MQHQQRGFGLFDASLSRGRPTARHLPCFSTKDEDMLRYAFLPSDFHPQILIFDERVDPGAPAAELRAFASGTVDGKALAWQQPTAPDTATRLVMMRETPPRRARQPFRAEPLRLEPRRCNRAALCRTYRGPSAGHRSRGFDDS
jgi:hypothetical protein